MKLKIKGSFLYNEDGQIIATFTDDITPEEERAIEVAAEAMPIIEKFVHDVNTGTHKPRGTVRELERILDKYKA